jgi:hypothetical protein
VGYPGGSFDPVRVHVHRTSKPVGWLRTAILLADDGGIRRTAFCAK